MNAFHGKQEIKDKYLNRIYGHMQADEIIKGRYWENGKGCAVGCTIHSGNHASYETELGIPSVLAKLEDGIFEGLPNNLAMSWPKRFLEAINVGANLESVWSKFAHWMLLDEQWGVIQFAKTDSQIVAIQKVGDLYLAQSQGLVLHLKDWQLARAAAYAAGDAAYAAAAAAYAYAAYAACDAAGAAAAAAAAAGAAKVKWRIAQADKLLELLRETEGK